MVSFYLWLLAAEWEQHNNRLQNAEWKNRRIKKLSDSSAINLVDVVVEAFYLLPRVAKLIHVIWTIVWLILNVRAQSDQHLMEILYWIVLINVE